MGEITTWLQEHHTAKGQPYGIINKESHFEVNDFLWQYWAEYEGDKLSFKVKGVCNVACVLCTLDSKKVLDWEDESVYCTIRL